MKNRFKVPKKKWNKWDCLSQYVFNDVFSSIKDGYDILFPLAAQNLPKKSIRVIAWNTAWIAANAAEDAPKK